MGNFYHKPAKQGDSPFTRSGLPPPVIAKKSNSDLPGHRIHDPMSLELHMADERVRSAGLTPAEREWRKKWVQDQHLHPDEPIHVEAVHRQLNPVRILYRLPLDTLYKRFLVPSLGVYNATAVRAFTPKFLMMLLGIEIAYYYWKYEAKDWSRLRGIETSPIRSALEKKVEIESNYPGLLETGSNDPAKYRYFSPSFDKREALHDIGAPTRPW
uniref:NADH dehydrogenase [ubiquinone] 1 beta subcomplex subunit 6 n=1 Tax=Parastrongyloides trichosuri TaxID=131310 RepID=A0A0N4ZT90_PARTI